MKTPSPLSGVRVLELGRLIAAPFCAQLLGDLGATVVKVERPGRGDEGRHYGPPFMPDREGRPTAESVFFQAVNRNKKSITVDFASPEGREIILLLARECDVFIENYKPGTLERYGLDFASLRSVNPDIIYLSVTGFGSTGPYAGRPATDVIVQGLSGLMAATAGPDGKPQKVGVAVIDMFTGLYAAVGVLAALRTRDGGGGGQAVGVALLDAGLALMTAKAMAAFAAVPDSDRAARPAPSALFACADGVLNVQATGDPDFRRLCRVLGIDDLADDPLYLTRTDRSRNREQLEGTLAAVFAGRSYQALYGELTAAGVMCAPVYSVAQAFADPHVEARNLKVEAEHEGLGSVTLVRSPLEFSQTPIVSYEPAPALGRHTAEVLRDHAGLGADEIAALQDRGVT